MSLSPILAPTQNQIVTAANAAALQELSLLCKATVWPTLSGDDLNYILTQATRADLYGRAPSDPNWVPTYNVPFGAMRGWELKAGYVATAYDTGDGQVKFNRSQALKGCEQMVKMFQRRCTATITTIAPQRSPITPIPAFPVGPAFQPTEYEQGNT